MTVDMPVPIKWAKWGSILLGFLAALWVTGVATIGAAVRWAAAPMIRDEARARQEETRARQAGDSLIVSRLESMDRKQDIQAAALGYPPDSKERAALLRLIQRIEPVEIVLPEAAKSQEQKK